MNRIASRAWVTWFLIAVLLGGTGLFVYEYLVHGENWVLSPGSPHIYDDHGKVTGTIVDRNGVLLLDQRDGGTYAQQEHLREAILHWVGDRKGNIQAGAVSHYSKLLSGYDPINGVYAYGGVGGTASLTISAQLQMAALEAMGDYVGTLAVYNYETGEILCAVTTPTFDPDNVPDIAGDTSGAFEGIYLNRFLQSAYIPGSIFKVVTTAAALEEIEGILDMRFSCTGKVPFGVDKVSCERVHGKQTFKEAMAVSCNCVYAQVAMLLGPKKLQFYADQFGVAERIRFDGITTVAGNYQFIGQADVNVAWSAIGQHLDQVNPCAYLSFIGAIANGGVTTLPHVVQRIQCGDDVTYEAQTAGGTRIMSEETARLMHEFMRNNVVSYYGTENFPDLKICAKTGTGQVDTGKKANAMFTGFLDDADMPYAFIVCIEDGGYGRKVCIPVISKVLEACIQLRDSL